MSAHDALGSAEKPADSPATEPAASHAESPEATSAEASSPEATAAPEPDSGLPSNEELNQFMDQYSPPQQAPTEGEVVEGRVIAVNNLGVVVDIGGKTEGLIPAQEFVEASDHTKLLPGQTIEVQLTGEHKEGYAVLSYQRARRRRVWADLDKAYREKTNVTGLHRNSIFGRCMNWTNGRAANSKSAC
jgi:predicted RNA-binding protein with RPS1 domain